MLAITLALHLCDLVHIAGFGYPDAHNRKQTIHYYEQITLKSMAVSGPCFQAGWDRAGDPWGGGESGAKGSDAARGSELELRPLIFWPESSVSGHTGRAVLVGASPGQGVPRSTGAVGSIRECSLGRGGPWESLSLLPWLSPQGSGHNVSQEALAIKRMLEIGVVKNLTFF